MGALTAPVCAQTAPVAPQVAPSERAQRDAEKVYRFIKLVGEAEAKKGKTKPEVTTPPTPAPAAAVAPAKPAATTAASKGGSKAGASGDAKATSADNTQLALVTPEVMPAPEVPASAQLPDARPAEGLTNDIVVVSTVEPEFSPQLMRALRKASAQIRLEIGVDGSVTGAKVIRSTNSRMESTALAAVKQWRFKPVIYPQTAVVDVGFDIE